MVGIIQKSNVEKHIITPMMVRWKAPEHEGIKIDAILADYIHDLSEFDESTLISAFTAVRRVHKYAKWPSAGEFRAACRDQTQSAMTFREPKDKLDKGATERITEAHAYLKKILLEDDIGAELFGAGVWLESRPYILDKVLVSLRNNERPYIPDNELREMIPVWTVERDARRDFTKAKNKSHRQVKKYRELSPVQKNPALLGQNLGQSREDEIKEEFEL